MGIPGTNIRVLRQQLGLSLKALASAAGMDHGNLSKLERGETGYSRDVLERIAKNLHVSVGVLFADTAIVEAAALRMRAVPVLSADDLAKWKGHGSLKLDEDHRHLHAALDQVSAHCFALVVADRANAPWFDEGDYLIFDASLQPKRDDFVVGMVDRKLFFGRFRPLEMTQDGTPLFEIVPIDPRSPTASNQVMSKLKLRGVLAESRRAFRQN